MNESTWNKALWYAHEVYLHAGLIEARFSISGPAKIERIWQQVSPQLDSPPENPKVDLKEVKKKLREVGELYFFIATSDNPDGMIPLSLIPFDESRPYVLAEPIELEEKEFMAFKLRFKTPTSCLGTPNAAWSFHAWGRTRDRT